MKYVNLGRSGLKVSRLCLGCMSYGEPERLPQPWSLDEKASRPLIRQALEAGINFFDTANIYSGGSSEEITGKALREMARRDEIVVATKTFFPWRNSPNTGFLSRKAIFKSIDDSLMRLGMDYVDLFQIHRFDYSTPVEETIEALHDVVKAGKWCFCDGPTTARIQAAPCFWPGHRAGSVAGYAADRCCRTAGLD